MVIKVIGAFLAISAFALALETPKCYLKYAGIVGAIGWFVFLLSQNMGAGEVLSTFLSAMSISIVSHIFARVFKMPVTVFLVAGILPTVPGAGMYRIAYNVIAGNNEMVAYYMLTTLELAGAIALGIFVVDSFFRIFQKDFKQNSLKYEKMNEKQEKNSNSGKKMAKN